MIKKYPFIMQEAPPEKTPEETPAEEPAGEETPAE